MAKDLKTRLTENMVLASTEFGIAMVQEIAEQSLIMQPGMSLRDFTKVLNQYVGKARRAAASANPSG